MNKNNKTIKVFELKEKISREDVVLVITFSSDDRWEINLKRSYAERIIKDFEERIFKTGTILIGNLDMGQKVQIINLRNVNTMAIMEKSNLTDELIKYMENKK